MWALDEHLHPFQSLFTGLADLEARMSAPELGVAMQVERAAFDLPVELHVEVGDDGDVRLIGAPPTQQVETSWMPVFHQIRLTVERDAG